VVEDSTAEAEDFMEEAEDFMEEAQERSAVVEVSMGEAALGSAAHAASADIGAAISEVGAVTVGAVAATAGAEGIGGVDTVMDGAAAGDLAMGGRIGVGDIPMATTVPTTARGITRLTPIMITRTTVLLTIPRTIRILTTGTTILRPQIPTRGPRPIRTDRQDPGDPRYQEAERTQTTHTAMSRELRRAGQFSPLTG